MQNQMLAICLMAFLSVSNADLDDFPVNVATYTGENVTLICSGLTGSGYRVQWIEYAYNPNGNLVTDNDLVLPSHPQAARYSVEQITPDTFNLRISDVQLEDAGTYVCIDANGVDLGMSQLITINGLPNCTSTMPENGIMIENTYYTLECLVLYKGNISPILTWSGTPPYNTGMERGDNSVFSAVEFYVSRLHDTSNWICFFNFTYNFIAPPQHADNVPILEYTYASTQMFVLWAPSEVMTIPDPATTFYNINDTILCQADARPAAQFIFTNIRTNTIYFSETFVIGDDLEGTTQLVRCQAQNNINGALYTGNIIINVTCPLRTTTPPPTTPTTTLPPPAEAPCYDLTGTWGSASPINAQMCVSIDLSNNGLLTGGLKNSTDTYYIEVVGRTATDNYDQIAFIGIWPGTTGISSFVGECHNCYGIEHIIVDDIQRIKGTGSCGVSGPLQYTNSYTFLRIPGICL